MQGYVDTPDVSKNISPVDIQHKVRQLSFNILTHFLEHMSTLLPSTLLPKARSCLEIDDIPIPHNLPSRIETRRQCQPTQICPDSQIRITSLNVWKWSLTLPGEGLAKWYQWYQQITEQLRDLSRGFRQRAIPN